MSKIDHQKPQKLMEPDLKAINDHLSQDKENYVKIEWIIGEINITYGNRMEDMDE